MSRRAARLPGRGAAQLPIDAVSLLTPSLIACGSPSMRDRFEAHFKKYRVNLVLHGHCHNYERTFPMYDETVRGGAARLCLPTSPCCAA